MTDIVDLQMLELQKRLEDRRISLQVSDPARQWLANKGYDPKFGARPLKRVMKTSIQNALAEKLLSQEFQDGDHIIVDISDLEDNLLLRQSSELQEHVPLPQEESLS